MEDGGMLDLGVLGRAVGPLRPVPAVAAAVLLAGIGLAAAGCSTISLREGEDPLFTDELPEWARRVETSMPPGDLLEKAAAGIEAKPPKRDSMFTLHTPWNRGASYLNQSICGLGEYDPGDLLPPPHRRRGHLLLWDGIPGHRFLYYKGAGGAAFPPFAADAEAEVCCFDSGSSHPIPIHRGGIFLSPPYSCIWSTRPAGLPLEDFLRGTVARENDGDPGSYRVEETHILLCGLFCWGRVNRTRYIQVLWIPIPVGRVVVGVVVGDVHK
jgi:hypothetical protein